MTKRVPYTYVVLRYAHDPGTGERLNIGVLIHFQDPPNAHVIIERSGYRLRDAFNSFDVEEYRRVIYDAERTIAQLAPRAHQYASAFEVATVLWPDRGLSFQHGETVGGLTTDPENVADSIYRRFVTSQQSRDSVSLVMQDDMAALLRALGISDHARNASPHEVMVNEIIPKVAELSKTATAR